MALRTLDLTRAYTTVNEAFGEDGTRVYHEQDGARFDRRGYEIINGVVVQDDDPEPPPSDAPVVDFRKLPTVQLRALVQAYGETYTTKQAALAFLEGRSVNSLISLDEQ